MHALRLKGFAKAEMVAELACVPHDEATAHLDGLRQRELAAYREARGLWQLTPAGREAHAAALAADIAGIDLESTLAPAYRDFLPLNERLKSLCSDWQVRDGSPNDHADAAYDSAVVSQLVDVDAQVQPIVSEIGAVLDRLAAYGPRLRRTCQRVVDGDTRMLTGVMCGSYHDVWMELHEDLILTQGIDRAAEGSF
jgi:hypothetical protein